MSRFIPGAGGRQLDLNDFKPPPDDDEEKEKQNQPGDNPQYGEIGGFPGEPIEFTWQSKLRTDLIGWAEKLADDLGVPKFAIDSMLRDRFDTIANWVNGAVIRPMFNTTSVTFDPETGAGSINKPSGIYDPNKERPLTLEEYATVFQAAQVYASGLLGIDPEVAMQGPKGSGSGRRGSRGPTAAEIRAQFDLDELTDATNRLWQGWVLTDAPNARKIAEGYVNEIVRTGGQQKIDFQTYVTKKIKNTNRYKVLSHGKPEHMELPQYLAPYAQVAAQVMGGADSSAVAYGGAALGASSDSFRQRLARTDQNRNSQGFITGLEQRLRGIKNVLRG